MYCKHCGKEIDDDSTFCKHCGGKLNPQPQENVNSNVILKTNEESPIKIEFSKKNQSKKTFKVDKTLIADGFIAVFKELYKLMLIAIIVMIASIVIQRLAGVLGLTAMEPGTDFGAIVFSIIAFVILGRYFKMLCKWINQNKSNNVH